MTVDLSGMQEKQQVNIELMPLNQFMEVHPFDRMASSQAGVVTYFDLDEDIRNMAEVLSTFKDCHIFSVFWENTAKRMVATETEDDYLNQDEEEDDIVATPEMIHDDIFQPCYAKYRDLYTCLKDGSIRLEEVNQFFRDYKGKYEELAEELDIMRNVDKSPDKQWILTRVQQIEQYHELHLAVASAEMITKVKETLCLQGDFRVLETLTGVVSGHDFN